jgi:hypothetical protein
MSRLLARTDVEAVAEWLHDAGVDFVVVGGSAIETRANAGTRDVDVLILVGDWDAISRAVRDDPAADGLEPDYGQLRGTRVRLGGLEPVDLEFISAEPFCGSRTSDEFVEYVRSYRSEKIGRVRYATPGAVWYIRLSLDDFWSQYVSKIRREIVAGIPESTLDEAVDIAKHFGVAERIRERVAETRRMLAIYRD